MSGSYAVNGIGSDPYFQAVLQSYNPAMMTAQQQQANYAQLMKAYEAALQEPYAAATSTMTQPQYVVKPAAKKEESHTMRNLAVTAAVVTAGTAIYGMYKGKTWNPIEGLKTVGKSLKAAWNSAGKKTTEGVTEKLKVIVGKDGKLSYLVPGKTEVIKEANVAAKASEYGIDLKKLIGFKGGSNVLDGATFKLDGNTVTFADGKISKILNNSGSDVTKEMLAKAKSGTGADKDFIARIEQQIAEYITNASKMEKGWSKGLTNISVTRQIGDNIAKVSYNNGSKPVVKQLTTLERLSADSDAVKNFFYENPRLKELFTSKDWTAGKLLNGTNIVSCEVPFDGRTLKFEAGKLVGFIEGAKYYPRGHEKFGSYLADNETKINDYIKNIFKDNKIPSDVTAILQAV